MRTIRQKNHGNLLKGTQPGCVTSGQSRLQPYPLGQNFSDSLLILGAGSFFVVEKRGCPVHQRMFNSIPESCLLAPSHQLWQTKMCPDTSKCPLRCETAPLRTIGLVRKWLHNKQLNRWIYIYTVLYPTYKIFISLWSEYDWSIVLFKVYILSVRIILIPKYILMPHIF